MAGIREHQIGEEQLGGNCDYAGETWYDSGAAWQWWRSEK